MCPSANRTGVLIRKGYLETETHTGRPHIKTVVLLPGEEHQRFLENHQPPREGHGGASGGAKPPDTLGLGFWPPQRCNNALVFKPPVCGRSFWWFWETGPCTIEYYLALKRDEGLLPAPGWISLNNIGWERTRHGSSRGAWLRSYGWKEPVNA